MNYENFDLEAIEYRKEGKVERFRVRVAASPAGEQTVGDAEEVSFDDSLRKKLMSLERRALNFKEMMALGEELGGLLFPPRARSFLLRSRERLSEDRGLRVRLKLDTYALADLSWEYSYIPNENTPPEQRSVEGFLVFDRQISLVRYEMLGRAPGRLDPVGTGALRLVALLANPKDTRVLDLESEQQNIKRALQGIPNIYPEFYPNATIDVLLNALVQNAHIFHFSGHAKFEGDMGVSYGSQEGKGFLSLVGDDQQEAPFSAEKLALNLAGRGVRMAMLSACESSKVDRVNAWTGIAPALTRAGIPAVVGMQFTVRDTNAITFGKSFYRALAAGQSIDAAVTDGRRAVFTHGDENERDWGVPVLYLRASEGVLFPKADEGRAAVVADTQANRQGAAPASVAPKEKEVSVDKRLLRAVMTQAFNLEELESLCAEVQQDLSDADIDLQVNLEMIGGSTRTAKVLNLIEYLDRRSLLSYLEKAVRAARKGMF